MVDTKSARQKKIVFFIALEFSPYSNASRSNWFAVPVQIRFKFMQEGNNPAQSRSKPVWATDFEIKRPDPPLVPGAGFFPKPGS